MADFVELMIPRREYRLQDVALSLESDKVRFQALLLGPKGAAVWARAWISDADGTLAETAAPKATAGDQVIIDVPRPSSISGCAAYIRIESKPLETEHILVQRLD